MRFGSRLNYYTATVADLKKSFFEYRDSELSQSGNTAKQVRTITDPGDDGATPSCESSFVICEASHAYGGGVRVSFLDGSTRLRTLRSSGVPPLLLRCYALPEREANVEADAPSDSDHPASVATGGAPAKSATPATNEVDGGKVEGEAETATLDQPSANDSVKVADEAWQCTACTFASNAAGTSACSVCGTLNAEGQKAVSDAAAAALQGALSSTTEANGHNPAEEPCRDSSTSDGGAETKYMDDECIVCYCEVCVVLHYSCVGVGVVCLCPVSIELTTYAFCVADLASCVVVRCW